METSLPKRARGAVTLLAALALAACGIATWNPTLRTTADMPADPGERDAYLKVHMTSGELYVLDRWTRPEAGQPLTGSGSRFGVDRNLEESGQFSVPVADIALLETNRREAVSEMSIGGLVVYSVLMGATTVACLADPKSCFGSCPTFYAVGDEERPLAEGFSASFARALENDDVDDLGVRADPGPFSLVMRNEALETHAVRHVRLRAVPASAVGPPIRTTHGGFVTATSVAAPLTCSSGEGDCLARVSALDDLEYAPRTDAEDLAAREEMILDFGPTSGEVGLVVTARNSFVTTYVFYQSLAYAGARAGELLAALERGEPGAEERVLGMSRTLGDIEAFVSEDDRPWRSIGSFGEPGPIAADRQLIRIGRVDTGNLRVRLRMAQGSWRIDELGLALLGEPIVPVELAVDSVTWTHPTGGDAASRLIDPDQYLVTVPGDEYRLWFTVPGEAPHDLFLDTRGYYYEWMRDAWLAEESSTALALLMLQPELALKRMAPGFKEIEPEMERLFWASRFRRP
jgi:hypothetical protein